jgi:chromosome partitioning protein
MPKKVCLVNMKGGVGKSTFAVQLAWHYAAYPNWLKKVLVVDTDPQFNASQYLLGIEKYRQIREGGKPTLWDLYRWPIDSPEAVHAKDAIVKVVRMKNGGLIDIIPSQPELATALKEPRDKESMLAKTVKEVEDGYDIVFIDCPPTESLFTSSAYLASDFALIPVRPEFLSTIGLPLIRNSLDRFHAEHPDHELRLAGVVFNSTTNHGREEKTAKEEVMDLATNLGWYVFKSEVKYSRAYPNSARLGKPIFWTPRTRENNIVGFHALAEELAQRLGI